MKIVSITASQIVDRLPEALKHRVLSTENSANSGLPYFSISVAPTEDPALWASILRYETVNALRKANNRNGALLDIKGDTLLSFEIRYAFTREEAKTLDDTRKNRGNEWDIQKQHLFRRKYL